jgi:hypothetical protein
MKNEEQLFRTKGDHQKEFSWKYTRSELLSQLSKHCVERSRSWPYSILPGRTITVKNSCGKEIQVLRELSSDQQRIQKIIQ